MRLCCGFLLFASLLTREAALKERESAFSSGRERRGKHGTSVGTIGVLLLLSTMLCGAARAEEPVYEIDIPSMNAAQALNRFAEQTGAIMLFSYDLASARRTNAVRGRYTLLEGLELLLRGTGLSGGLSDKRVVNISRSGNARRPGEETPVSNEKASLRKRIGAFFTSMLAASAAASQEAGVQTHPLEEIIVTAQKRSENIQDVPSSVSVVGKELLENLHVTQLTDVGAYVPGLQIASGGTPGQATIIIRGVAPLGPGATVGTYIDDTPVGGSSGYARNTSFALDLLPYDVQRMEVLRGPQGTLYGASTMGGLLKYVLTPPDASGFQARVGTDAFDIQGAGDAGWGARAMINAPLVQDELAILGSYARVSTPGYIDNAQTGARHQNDVDQESARVSLLWQPTDQISLTLGALHQQTDADGVGQVALSPTRPTPLPVAGELNGNNYVGEAFSKRIDYFSATLSWDLGWAEFISASSYADTLTEQETDVTRTYGGLYPLFGSPAGLSEFFIDLDLQKVTQEFRLASPAGGKVDWLLGAFYTDEDSGNEQLLTAQAFDGASIPGLDPLFIGSIPSTYKEYAAFGGVTFHLTDRFEIAAGLRYARNEQTFRQASSGSLVSTTDTPGSSTENVTTYSVSSAFHFTDDVMAYARVASGYQPGGPNVVLPNVPPTYDSSSLTNYELGLKSEFGRRGLLDLSIFQIDWSDIQIGATNAQGFSFFSNGGTARSRGVEASGSLRLTDALVLTATGAYTDATLTADAPSVGGLSGDRLANIPRWSGSILADYSRALSGDWRVHAGLGLRVVEDRNSSVTHSRFSFALPSYHAFDLNADVSNSRWTVRLFAKNLTNERAYLGYAVLTNGLTGQAEQLLGAVLQPRTVGLAVDVAF
jgi:iron complex outermembrane receptor protein